MSNYSLAAIIIGYLGLLFLIALWAEKNAKSKWVSNPYIYTLSLAVYCSAWTYYGSVGIAATSGISFLTVYLGPVIALPLWIMVMAKIIRISKQHNISSIADFISLRYGNSRVLGGLVTIICVIGILPYISLQLKAVSETFQILSNEPESASQSIFGDTTFYIALLLAVFVAFFGTQATDATKRRRGIVTTVAFESILKLIFFLTIGIYVTYYLFDGTQDIHDKISGTENFGELTSLNGLEAGINWFFMIILSFLMIFLLPRQFQVSVVENERKKDLKKAIWLFSFYLLLFNIFVIFIAWGGNLMVTGDVNADYYTILLPLQQGNIFLAALVFLGGFSAVISMVVVSTLALSTMLSNNLIIPYGFLGKFSKGHPEKNSNYIKNIRRIAIFSLIITAYFFYIAFSIELSLFSIGLISFVIIAQLAPSFFIGLFWNRGAAKAAIIGLIAGSSVTAYTLILPFMLDAMLGASGFIENGPFGIAYLKPYELFGIDFLDPVAHAFFWSMFFNLGCYLTFSVLTKGNYRERNYAEMFVDSSNYASLQDNALVWKGEAFVADIRNVLKRFLGGAQTEKALNQYYIKYGMAKDAQMADAGLINFSEKLLTGSIGSASAKILISSVVKEEEISLREVLKILEESKEALATNKTLKEKSDELIKLTQELKIANDGLRTKDRQKDEFLDTLAHELKTPITAIRASSEILIENDAEMDAAIKQKFLGNMMTDTERLSRLINDILDLEKLSSGREMLDRQEHSIADTVQTAINSIRQIAVSKQIKIVNLASKDILGHYDEDRILQVVTNLLSNAVKFCEQGTGLISIQTEKTGRYLQVVVEDNGKGIAKEDFKYIFDKFYQSQNQNIKKPQGSGFGLAICKHIIETHKGKIWADKNCKQGARFIFKIPA